MSDDAFTGIENQDDKRFFHRIIPVSFWNVLPPILRYLIRFRQQFSHRFTFTDAQHFEFMRDVWFHVKKGRTLWLKSIRPGLIWFNVQWSACHDAQTVSLRAL